MFFPGDAMIAVNGSIVARAAMYSLAEVEVVVAAIDLDTIRSFRSLCRSRCLHAAHSNAYPRIQVRFSHPVSLYGIATLNLKDGKPAGSH